MDILLVVMSALALLGLVAAIASAESRDGFDRDGRLDPVSPLDTRNP
jgi:hypothetical protein